MSEAQTLPATARQHKFEDQFLEPFNRFRGEVDRMFDEFPARWSGLQLPTRFGAGSRMPTPAIEMTETAKAYRISVEVAGVEPDAINLEIDGDILVLKGEKREERDEEEENHKLSERSYGSFERRIILPSDAIPGEIDAHAKNGVLKITVPRNGDASAQRRRIEIKSAKKD